MVKAMEADDNQSWQARCDRYFSSLTEADDTEEKAAGNQTKETTASQDGGVEASKQLSEEHRVAKRDRRAIRYARQVLCRLDIHGLRYGAKSETVIELLMWIVIGLAGLAALSFMIYIQFKEYQNLTNYFQTTSISELKHHDFPTVSFCNLNVLKKSSVVGSRFEDLISIENNLNVPRNRVSPKTNSPSVQNILQTSYPDVLRLVEDATGEVLQDFLTSLGEDHVIKNGGAGGDISALYELGLSGRSGELKAFVAPTVSEVQSLGHSKETMVLQCWLGDRQCRDRDVKMVQDGSYGNCVSVSTGFSTSNNVLEVVLDLETDEYLNVLTDAVGVAIVLHSGHEVREGRSLVASPHSATRITIQQVTDVSYISGDCVETQGYSQQICRVTCRDEAIRKQCGCHYTPTSTTQKRCRPEILSEYVCMRALMKLSEMDLLSCHCPQPCRTTDIVFTDSNVQWPSASHMAHLQNELGSSGRNVTESYIRHNLAKVTVDLGQAKKVLLKEKAPNSVLDLLAKIGGVSALIIGVSVVSLAELLWTAIKTAWYCSRDARRKKRESGVKERLTDSEFTSVTWAVHRDGRKDEDRGKEKRQRSSRDHSLCHNGNAHAQISNRRNHGNAPLKPIQEENCDKKLNNARAAAGLYPWVPQHGYRHFWHSSRNRSSGSEYPLLGGSLDNVSQLAPARGTGLSDSRPETSRPSLLHVDRLPRTSTMKPSVGYPGQGRLVTPADAIQLYGGSSAHFYTNCVSEPMYL